MRLKTYILR